MIAFEILAVTSKIHPLVKWVTGFPTRSKNCKLRRELFDAVPHAFGTSLFIQEFFFPFLLFQFELYKDSFVCFIKAGATKSLVQDF